VRDCGNAMASAMSFWFPPLRFVSVYLKRQSLHLPKTDSTTNDMGPIGPGDPKNIPRTYQGMVLRIPTRIKMAATNAATTAQESSDRSRFRVASLGSADFGSVTVVLLIVRKAILRSEWFAIASPALVS